MTIGANPANRLKRPSWKDPRLLIGLLLVLASVAGVVALVGNVDRTVSVYAAAQDIGVGQKLDQSVLLKVKVQLGDLQGSYLLSAEDVPTDSVAVQAIRQGQLVARDSVGQTDALHRKPVALKLETPLPTGVRKGSLVDVWVLGPDAKAGSPAGSASSESKKMLNAAEISEIKAAGSGLGADSSTTIYVLVPEQQLPQILTALASKATISVVWNPAGARG
ncbi:hypothetical protein [Psychromicrobium xiongbiense]|uniref:hypothetical protein n=1 Tax=Psychromicrobium xiongbiense TaxID=3051184 RepID=UPI002555FB8B|nr:hypothetical protein [Psychromicrobium sp. YIM S02556]